MSAEELLDKLIAGEVVTIKGKAVLTGDMWYDRFEKELPSVLNMLSDESATTVALEAAKRASGLDN